MVSITKDIRKYLQYQITAKARGYYDKSITTIFTEDNPSLDLGELTPYDGLKYTVDLSKNSVRPGEINFDGTVLPYVENNTLTKTNYCFGNSGTNYDLPVYEKIYSNITKVGDVSINNGIASNFSSSDYLDLGNFDFSGDYEIVLKFKMPETDSDTANYKPFFDAKSNSYFNIAVTSYKNDNKRHIHSNSGNGSSWNTGIDGTTPLELNTEYYVKVVRSGTTRTMYLSTDNTTWSTEGSIEDTYNYNHSYCLGAASHLSSQEIFKGSFDLKESKITIGENIINLGDYSLQKQYTGYTTYGNAKVNNLVCSGFDSSSSSRVVLSNAKFNTSEPIYISFVMRADVSTRQKIFDTEDRLSFRVENGYFWYYKNENHTWIQWKSINANTGYKIKVTINSSSAYSIGLALINEGTYDYIDVTDTLNLTDGPVGIGNNLSGSYTQPFQGTIDISEIPGAYEVKTESKAGIFRDYEDDGKAKTLNAFSSNNEFVVLSPDENITDHTWLGKVNIPEHRISWNEPSVPDTLKFGDRIDNKATVVGEYSSNDGKKYVFAVLDAQYRGANIAWSTNLGINRIDTGLPNYSSVPAEQNKESATYNTNYILNDYSAVEAFTFCRNIESLRFDDKQYTCQLPNCYELQQIYNKKSELDALDPTAEANSTKKLSNWGFGSQYALVWSSNEYDSERSWLIDSSGLGKYSNKNNDTYGVCPIIEIPLG